MIEAAIFDMDGLLINSEPFWQESEKAVFKELGLDLTTEMCQQTMGLRVDEVVEHWFHHKPWANPDFKLTEEQILQNVEAFIRRDGKALEGVHETLELLKQQNIKLGLASSSHMRLIEVVVEKLNIKEFFEVIHSAEYEEYGKPHPAVYITTAHKLNTPPVNCLAFEDSVNGLIAAKAARMKVISVPDPTLWHLDKYCLADFKLKSLSDFNKRHLEQLTFN